MKEWLIKGLIVTLAVFSPITPLLIACGALIIIDTITGMFAARKRKERITSAEMRRAISKMVVYQLAIISAFILETYILDNALPVSKIVSGVIGMVEFKSIMENASTIAGKNLLKMMMKSLGSKNARIK